MNKDQSEQNIRWVKATVDNIPKDKHVFHVQWKQENGYTKQSLTHSDIVHPRTILNSLIYFKRKV